MRRFLLGLALTSAMAFPALAQETQIVQLPEGHTALNFSATEQVEVEQDMLVASLRIQSEAKDPKEVQNTINEAMQKAVEAARKVPSIKVETGQYYVHPDYRHINRPDGTHEQLLDKWRGTQTITLKGKVADDVLTVAGQLQDMDFLMNGLNYQLSPEKAEQVRDGLMEVTIESLTERARRVAAALGKSNVDIVEINVDAHMPPRPYPVMYARSAKMEMAAADAAMAAPTAEAGETTISMTISARAIIKP